MKTHLHKFEEGNSRKFKNSKLVQARTELGLKNINRASKAFGLEKCWGLYENNRENPVDVNGEWKQTSISISEKLWMEPEDIWPEEAEIVQNAKRMVEAEFEQERRDSEIENYERGPEKLFKIELLNDALKVILNDKERDIIEKRFFEEKTLESIGNDYDLSRSRIQSIEYEILRKLQKFLSIQKFFPKDVKPVVSDFESLNGNKWGFCRDKWHVVISEYFMTTRCGKILKQVALFKQERPEDKLCRACKKF